jgi:hypothetical protein
MASDTQHREVHVVAPLAGVGMSPRLKTNLGADLIQNFCHPLHIG